MLNNRLAISCFMLLCCMMCMVNPVLAQVPAGIALLPADISQYEAVGFEKNGNLVQEVTITGQSFTKALRINTFTQQSITGDFGISIPLTVSVKKGDILWLSFQSRCIKSTRESGEALIEARLDELIDGKFEWPSFMERGLSIGSNWVQTSIPIEIKELPFHSKSNGAILEPKHLRFIIRFDKIPQIIEIGPVTLLDCGQSVTISNLPRSVVSYDGAAPDAPWREAAAARIEKIRKGDLTIVVLDNKGKNIPNATVSVRMKKNAFVWGTCSSSYMLSSNTPNAKMYRDTLLRYFNQVVFENELKWKNWSKIKTYDPTFASIKWLNENNISVNGSVVVWPSWKHSPAGLDSLKNDTAALRKAILDRVRFVVSTLKGKIPEWDVINEITYHHNMVDIVGKPEMIKWYKAAHEIDPAATLFINDFTMFHQKENNADGADCDYIYNTIKYLLDNGAPLNAIAEQAHIGGTPPGIPHVLSRLDRFSKFKLPIAISEFDIYSDDDDFKAKYLGDFMTAIYSHPNTTGFTQWGFWSGAHWIPMAALWDKNWILRKHGKVYTDLVTKTWWTNFEGKTASNGSCKLRGFCGDYEVTVTHNGKSIQQQYSLTSKGGKVIVKL